MWQTRRIKAPTAQHNPKMADKQRLIRLPPGRAAPGMTLAAPVRDHEGSILLAADTLLDPALLERLLKRGVQAILVRVPDHRDEEMIARELAEVRARIETIFRGPGSAAREQLRKAILEYRTGSTQ